MFNQFSISTFFKKYKWFGYIIYWMMAALLLFFVFSNQRYSLNIRLLMVSVLLIFSFVSTYVINHYLVPQFLFKDRAHLFAYLVFGLFIFILWLSFFSIFGIMFYSAVSRPHIIIPSREDIIILVTGNLLIIILAAVIHFIKESFSRLVEKNMIEEQKHATEVKLKEASMKNLQSQIHPHFMFNMLNNLYALVAKDRDATRETIMKLSDLLDYMLYHCNKEFILLKQEIDFINNYIALERIRYGNNYDIQFEAHDKTFDYKIPPLILFPFVENAFKHGFRHADKGFLKIIIGETGEKLLFRCENSIAHLPSETDKYLKQEGSGIGLRNIRERLSLIYGDNYKLSIDSADNVFKVHLKIEKHK